MGEVVVGMEGGAINSINTQPTAVVVVKLKTLGWCCWSWVLVEEQGGQQSWNCAGTALLSVQRAG